jgi:hypothetical protein
LCLKLSAQTEDVPYASNTTAENRAKEYRNLVNNSINNNLSLTLTDSTEENWQAAFYALELIQYRSPWVDGRIRLAFDSVKERSIPFQRAFLELIYANYQKEFIPRILAFANKTYNTKLFAMCVEYITADNKLALYRNLFLKRIREIELMTNADNQDPFLKIIKHKLSGSTEKMPPVSDFLKNSFLNNEVVLFSFQRKNRNFPGLVMVRGKDGSFIKDESGNYFSVPQLARSNSNMAGYLTNGNTPQGIFRMIGFGISKSSFIGPTTNIQMVMPYEHSEDVPDSVTQNFGLDYSHLLPRSWKNYFPIYETYYAGLAGRTEVIAHGTTVNPEYYKNRPYYPLTPTQGCLCTKEIWSTVVGRRLESDQQKLINAVKAAGGANGYYIVIEINELQKAVSIGDILPLLSKK